MDDKKKEVPPTIPITPLKTQHIVNEVGTLDMRLFIRTAMNLRSFKK